MNDLTSQVIGVLIEPQALAATASGPAVSTAGAEGMIGVIARVGTPSVSTGTLSLQVETSGDGTTGWTALGSVLGAFTTAGGSASQSVNPASSRGFIRVTATVGGTGGPSFPISCFAIMTPHEH